MNALPDDLPDNARIEGTRREILTVVGLYAGFAALWILLSDLALEALFSDPRELTVASTLKGWGFVGVTAALLYALIARLASRLQAAQERGRASQAEKLRALRLLDVIAESSADAIFAKDAEGRYLLFNRAAARFTGVPADGVLGRDDRALFPPDQALLIMANDRRVMAEDRIVTFEEPLTTTAGELTFLATKGPLREPGGQVIGMFGVSRDITTLKQAERRLRISNRTLATLAQCNAALAGASDEAGLLAEVCRKVVEHGAYRMAWIGYAESDAARTVRPMAHAGFEAGYLDAVRISWADDEFGHGPTGTAIREGRPVVARRIQTDPDYAAWRAAAVSRGYGSSVALPLLIDTGRCIGALNLYAAEPDAFDDDELRLLADLAADLSGGIRALRDRIARDAAEDMLRQMSAIARIGAWTVQLPSGSIVWSDEVYRLYGVSPQTFDHSLESFLALIHPQDRPAMEEWLRACRAGESPGRLVFRVPLADGEERVLAGQGSLEIDAERRPLRMLGTVQDITERQRAENALAVQTQVLERVAIGAPLAGTLEHLARAIEALVPGMVTSILLLDDDGVRVRHGAAPSLPEPYLRALDGRPIGERAGSCGTAMWRREPVIVEDIDSDPLWADYRELAAAHGLRACWSTPILAGDGSVLGSFALYYRQPARPHEHHLELIALATHAAAIAIAQARAQKALRTSETRFRATFEQAAVGVAIVAPDGRWLRVNRKLCEIVGYTSDELLGITFQDITHPEDLDTDLDYVRQVLAGERASYSMDKRYRRHDASLVWVRLTVALVRKDSGEPDYFVSVVEDIDASRRAQDALRQSELRFRLAATHGQVWDWNVATGTSNFPGEFFRRLGYPAACASDPVQMLESIMHPDDLPRWRRAIAEHLRLRRPYELEFRALAQSGEWLWFLTTGQAVWDDAGRATYMAGTTFDITERKRAEEALAESEAKLRLFFDLPFIGMAITSPKSRQWIDVNQTLCDMLGYPRAELVQKTWTEITHPDDLAANLDLFERATAGEIDGYKLEKRFVRRDGSIIRAVIDVKCVRDAGGAVDFFVATIADVTARVAADAERDALRVRLTRILEGISDGFVALDRQWRYTYVNRRAAQLLGRDADAMLGRHIWTLFPEGLGQPFQRAYERAMEVGTTIVLEEYYPPWDRWFENRIHPYEDGLSIFFQDITERKRSEHALRESEDRYRTLVDLIPYGIQENDASGRITFANAALERLYGRPPGGSVGRMIWDFLADAAERETLRGYLAHLIADQPRPETYFVVSRGSGDRPIDVQVDWTYDRAADGVLRGFISVITDVTERKRAERQLREYTEQLQRLSHRLFAVQEEEKRALARELHDEFGQSLAALKLNLYSAKKLVGDEESRRRIRQCIDIAENVIVQIRGRALDLRPSILDDLGLAAALEWFVARQVALGGCGYSLSMDGLPAQRLDPQLEITVFRIVQESVNNARRHSGASHIRIGVETAADDLLVEIADDGQGFDVTAVLRRSREGGGIGLPGMQERAEILGGHLEVDAAPGRGTRVRARLPMAARLPALA